MKSIRTSCALYFIRALRCAVAAAARTMCAPALLCIAATATYAADAAPLNATFSGTGRACYGTLKVNQKQVTWKTPFSKCATRSFQVSELEAQDGRKRLLYELKEISKSCNYRTLVLTHPEPQQLESTWSLTAYRSYADYQASSTVHSMSCALVRSK